MTARRREQTRVASAIEDVLLGAPRRRLPDNVLATLESLDAARRPRPRTPVAA